MLHCDPQHVSRRTNCITKASGIVILEIGERSTVSRVTIPEAVVIQFVLLRMSSVLLETC